MMKGVSKYQSKDNSHLHGDNLKEEAEGNVKIWKAILKYKKARKSNPNRPMLMEIRARINKHKSQTSRKVNCFYSDKENHYDKDNRTKYKIRPLVYLVLKKKLSI